MQEIIEELINIKKQINEVKNSIEKKRELCLSDVDLRRYDEALVCIDSTLTDFLYVEMHLSRVGKG